MSISLHVQLTTSCCRFRPYGTAKEHARNSDALILCLKWQMHIPEWVSQEIPRRNDEEPIRTDESVEELMK